MLVAERRRVLKGRGTARRARRGVSAAEEELGVANEAVSDAERRWGESTEAR